MEILAFISLIICCQYMYFIAQVGKARVAHGVKAPAVTGHEEFERTLRVQQNTMEILVMFLPILWLFGSFVDYYVAAGFGLVFVVGRFLYSSAYIKDPSSRGSGFMVSVIPLMLMMLGLVFFLLKRIIFA